MRGKLFVAILGLGLVIGYMFGGLGGVATAHDNCVLGDVHLSAIDLCLITSTGTETGCALLPIEIPGLLDLCLINNIGDGDGDNGDDEGEDDGGPPGHENDSPGHEKHEGHGGHGND